MQGEFSTSLACHPLTKGCSKSGMKWNRAEHTVGTGSLSVPCRNPKLCFCKCEEQKGMKTGHSSWGWGRSGAPEHLGEWGMEQLVLWACRQERDGRERRAPSSCGYLQSLRVARNPNSLERVKQAKSTQKSLSKGVLRSWRDWEGGSEKKVPWKE